MALDNDLSFLTSQYESDLESQGPDEKEKK